MSPAVTRAVSDTAEPEVRDDPRTMPRRKVRSLPASELRFVLAAGDVVVGVMAVTVALAMWNITAGYPYGFAFISRHLGWFVAAPLWVVMLAASRQPQAAFSVGQTANRIVHAALALLFIYLAVYFYAPRQALPRLMVLHFIWQASILTFAWRLVYIWLSTATSLRGRSIIVGTGRSAQAILDVLEAHGARHREVAGLVTSDPADLRSVQAPPPIGDASALHAIVRREDAAEIIVALDRPPSTALVRALVECQEDGVDIVTMPAVYEQLLERIPVEYLEPDWMISSFADAVRAKEASRLAKRLTDVFAGAAGLLVLCIIGPAIGMAIWIDSGAPIFHSQDRVGLGGRLFRVFKFRTMLRSAEADGTARWAAPDDPRVTRRPVAETPAARRVAADAQRLPRRDELRRTAPRTPRVRRRSGAADSVLPDQAARAAGPDRLGAGVLSVRRFGPGRAGQARIRPLLHQAPLAFLRRADRVLDRGRGARAERKIVTSSTSW